MKKEQGKILGVVLAAALTFACMPVSAAEGEPKESDVHEGQSLENVSPLSDTEEAESVPKEKDSVPQEKESAPKEKESAPKETQSAAQGRDSALGSFRIMWNENDNTAVILEYNGEETALVIPAEIDGRVVTGIKEGFNNDQITSVTIPASVTSIGRWAFTSSDALSSITVAEGNPKYASEDGVLFNKDKTELLVFPNGRSGPYEIPEGVQAIGEDAFNWYYDGDGGITSVKIPASLTDVTGGIFGFVFSECPDLSTITVAEGNPKYASEDGVLFSKDKKELVFFPRGRSGPYAIPERVEVIGSQAFYHAVEMTSVTIPEGVRVIGAGSFTDCRITSVTIPSSVRTIEHSAFDYCRFLATITIEEGVESIGKYAFGTTHSLTSITIPSSVRIMEDAVFDDSGLKYVTIKEGVTKMGSCVFGNTQVKSITLPASLTDIDENLFCKTWLDTLYIHRGSEAERRIKDMNWLDGVSIRYVETDEPVNPDAGSGAGQTAAAPAVKPAPALPTSPRTGDESRIGLWSVLSVLALCGVFALGAWEKKRRSGRR